MAPAPSINRHNVGRIAERIVSNELEYRGFRVSDLNKEGTSCGSSRGQGRQDVADSGEGRDRGQRMVG